ncbi:MAG: DNA repair protein RadA, partial [Bacteroidetes bacterium]
MKPQTKYVCQACGYESPRWTGKCPSCAQWNTFQEEVAQKVHARKVIKQTQLQATPLDEISLDEDHRITTSNVEFDRVLGGGTVRGSVILLGGDPGVGKSTLMMQLAAQMKNEIVLYISGEESSKQIKMRAERLGLPGTNKLLLFTETNI